MYKTIKTKILPQAFNIIEGFIDLIPRMGVYLYSNDQGQWIEIAVQNEDLYNYLINVLGDLVDQQEQEQERIKVIKKEFLEYGTVIAESGLNIRELDNLQGRVIGVLDFGQRVKIIDKQDNWYKIELPVKGWVYSPYVACTNTPAEIDSKLLEFTESWEGFSSTAYQDFGGNWTIGFGDCSYKVKPNYTVERKQAGEMLRATLNRIAENINKQLGYLCLNQNQFNSLVDFCYNLGFESLLSSTLLKDIELCKDNATLTKDFDMWDYCNGQQLTGLLNRRKAEAVIFTAGEYNNN